jgi:HYDIN/CFA65/VesB-like, Ig-like domain/Beta-propeller repeat/Cep192 domain 4
MSEGNKPAMIVFMTLLAFLGLVQPSAAQGPEHSQGSSPALKIQNRRDIRYARLPMSFERNEGQVDGRVKYLSRGLGYTLFLTGDGAVLKLQGESEGGQSGPRTPNPQTRSSVLRLKLVGANLPTDVSGLEELPGKANYFIGKDAGQWRRGVPLYERVKYAGVYEGIDLVYYGNQEELEYDFKVGAGRDAKRIGLRVEGAKRVKVNGAGELVMEVGSGEVKLKRPEAYQEAGGKREKVEARYALREDGEIGFEVGRYDRRRELVIDPVLTYATYLGGSGGDVAYGVAVDASGNAYVTGITASVNFPSKSAAQTVNAGGSDAFVAKLNSSGTRLIFSTYLGGTGIDSASGIAIDSAGNSYIAGNTYSSDFPATSGAFQTAYGGDGDGFVAKLGPLGSSLIYASYLGGTSPDFAQGIAIDSAGDAFLTGSTRSSDFPTVAPLQIGNDGCSNISGSTVCSSDAFVTKVSPAGDSLIYSTYLGGSQADIGQAIAIDSSGDAYVTGYTFSSDFPTQNAFQSGNAGGADIFVTELNPAGSALLFSTYLGGGQQERAFAIALDSDGNIYLTGDTQSANFPTTSTASQLQYAGAGDAFVSKIGPGGSGLIYSTFLGGSGVDQANAIAVDADGNAYVAGLTESGDFPMLNPTQTNLGLFGAGLCGTEVCSDAFVTKLLPSSQLVYSTFFGGSGAETAQAIAVDSAGNATAVGGTNSQNLPVISVALQGGYAGLGSSSNAFVLRIAGSDLPAVSLNPQQLSFGNETLYDTSDPQSVTLVNEGSSPLNITSISASGDFTQSNNCGTIVPSAGGNCTIQIRFNPTTIGTRTDQVIVNDNAQGSPHPITIIGTGVAASTGAVTLSPTSLSFTSEPVGATSPTQTVNLTNTGKTSLTLADISVSGDFTQTNTCGTLPSSLNVGDSCSFTVAFSPINSGRRTGAIVIKDDAAGSPQSVPLSGTGEPIFSLSASNRSTVLQIGTTTTTFTVTASAPSSFTDTISLACSGATCSFDPPSITAGETSTLTISGMNATTANPLNITVTGTAGGQSASVALAVFLADFTISASPPLITISSGGTAVYTITVNPTNNFSGVVLLSCMTSTTSSVFPFPPGATCTWSPPGLTMDGTPQTSKLTITTVSSTAAPPGFPSGPGPGFGNRMPHAKWLVWLAVFLLGGLSIVRRRPGGKLATRLVAGARLAALAGLLLMASAGVGCNDYSYGPNLLPAQPGTPLGKYTIELKGTLGNDTTVIRATTINLAVGS